MTRHDIHKKIIEHYGIGLQLEKASEELRELDKEVWIYADKENNRQAVLTEIADVLNCIEQLKLMLDISDAEIEQEQNRKMQRTLNRMSENIGQMEEE